MKRLFEALTKPLHFSLLIGVTIGTLVYYVGAWSVPYAKNAGERELTIIAQNLTEALLIGARSRNKPVGILLLKEALKKAAGHPRVVSASVRSTLYGFNEMAVKSKDHPPARTFEFNQPITNTEGQLIGSATLELTEDTNQLTLPLKRQVQLFALFGFLLGFAFCYTILYKREDYLRRLVFALKNVSEGNFDVSPPGGDTKTQQEVAHAFNKMVVDLRERDRMRHSLGRIMDPKIAEILIKENPKLGGLRRKATILFCDIRNYTAICEQLTVDELQEFLNDYWKGTVEIIMEQEGTIDKFHGDGVCVIFGAPNLHEDDPLRAVRAAWRLIQNVDKLNEKRTSQRKLPIEIGIGIHTGEVIAGNIGSERRMDYTVVGDVVNVAARIEELNKKFGSRILISDSLYEKVELYVRVKTLSLAHLRGHKRPILVHALREFIDIPEQQEKPKAA